MRKHLATLFRESLVGVHSKGPSLRSYSQQPFFRSQPFLKFQAEQRQPGHETKMHPAPKSFMENYKAAGKLKGKRALITGGDSGIGRAVAIGFAKEGADVLIVYKDEDDDAKITQDKVRAEGRQCVLMRGDVGAESFCKESIEAIIKKLGGLDILVNNAAEQHVQQTIDEITAEELERTFRTNIFSMFYFVKAALPHLNAGSSIINTTSVNSYKGNDHLVGYSATKGAITNFTYSMSQQLVTKGIRVNAVAPGPIWTPLIPATFPPDKLKEFGKSVPMGRPGQPDEVAPSFIFLASEDASYITGQVIHPNGGTVVQG